jgi:hypothetical protein
VCRLDHILHLSTHLYPSVCLSIYSSILLLSQESLTSNEFVSHPHRIISYPFQSHRLASHQIRIKYQDDSLGDLQYQAIQHQCTAIKTRIMAAESTPKAKPHVLIIGAGLSGLTLAQCLRKRGIPFEIFDRDTDITARHGWAISLHT